jgi:CMP-N-acetylneuraminic acid synthetase
VPMKNLAAFGGRPLIDYCIAAGKVSENVSRLLCSTDSEEIASRCRQLGIEVHPRPHELGQDETPLFDVIVHLVEDIASREGAVAELFALLQPTSPFVLPKHVDDCVRSLVRDSHAVSAQTIVECPHNHHAFNQRVVNNGYVSFRFLEERKCAYNKQTKPKHYFFGNVVVFRLREALKQGIVFAEPSIPVVIPYFYGFDCDGPDDFVIGDLMLTNGLVSLPHIVSQSSS